MLWCELPLNVAGCTAFSGSFLRHHLGANIHTFEVRVSFHRPLHTWQHRPPPVVCVPGAEGYLRVLAHTLNSSNLATVATSASGGGRMMASFSLTPCRGRLGSSFAPQPSKRWVGSRFCLLRRFASKSPARLQFHWGRCRNVAAFAVLQGAMFHASPSLCS